MNLKLALISDIHLGIDNDFVLGSSSLAALDTALSHFQELQPDLLVDLGDRITDSNATTDLSNMQAIKARYDSLNSAKTFLRGNHDLVPLEQQQALLGKLGNRSQDINGWHLIFLDTFNQTIEGSLDKAALDWLEHDLASTNLPTIVFSHQPLDGEKLLGNPIFEEAFAAHAHPKGHERARELIEASGKVKLAFNGHCHWSHLVQRRGLNYISLQSLVARTEKGPAGSYAFLQLSDKEMRLELFGLERSSFHLIW